MATTNTNKHWALQRKLLMNTKTGFNAEVYRHFKDVVDNDAATSATRKTLRDSLLINLKDSRTTASFKVQYFREQVQKVHHKPTIIGIEKGELDMQLSVAYKPHVVLFFRQNLSAVPDEYTAIKARISFRLTTETSTTLTPAKLETLANQIKTELALNNGYTFDKGKVLCKYIDKENGYDLQIYALNKAEGEQVIKKIVGIRNHSFDGDKFQVNTPDKDSVNTTPNITILGETHKKARWRPTAKVRFMYADLLLHNKMEPICLVDRSGLRSRAIVKTY